MSDDKPLTRQVLMVGKYMITINEDNIELIQSLEPCNFLNVSIKIEDVGEV